jgi:hypothetical protein
MDRLTALWLKQEKLLDRVMEVSDLDELGGAPLPVLRRTAGVLLQMMDVVVDVMSECGETARAAEHRAEISILVEESKNAAANEETMVEWMNERLLPFCAELRKDLRVVIERGAVAERRD